MKTSFISIRTVAHTSLVILLGVTLVACDKKKPTGPNYKEIEAARVAMVDWLECEECTEGQLKNVLEHSARLQPMLVSTLKKGVAPASRELYKRELEKRYDELIAYSRTNKHSKPTLPKDEFVKLYLGRLTAQYQTRAAKALSAIGGDKSKQALKEALNKTKSDDVRQVIKQALEESK